MREGCGRRLVWKKGDFLGPAHGAAGARGLWAGEHHGAALGMGRRHGAEPPGGLVLGE